MRTVALVLFVAALSGACSAPRGVLPQDAAARETHALHDLNGTWTGRLARLDAPGLSKRSPDYDLWVTIEGDRVDLWFQFEGRWVQLWNGNARFSIARHKSNAVIFASHSKPEVECHWVETWTLNASQFRPGELTTFFHRMVNNTGCPGQGQFAAGATGALKRTSASVVKPQPIGTY